MTITIKNWKRFQTGEYQPDWIRLPRDLVTDPDWMDLSGDDAKGLIQILLAADEFGQIEDGSSCSRATQRLLTRLSKWWRRGHAKPVELPDETEYVQCRRCKGSGTLPMSEIATAEFDPSDPINRVKCWACEGTGEFEALKESSTAKDLIFPDTEQWYAWYHWFEQTNLFAVAEMEKARDAKRPYPVETEWPPEPKRRSIGGV